MNVRASFVGPVLGHRVEQSEVEHVRLRGQVATTGRQRRQTVLRHSLRVAVVSVQHLEF